MLTLVISVCDLASIEDGKADLDKCEDIGDDVAGELSSCVRVCHRDLDLLAS